MSGAVERYRPYGVARQHRHELDAIERQRQIAEDRVHAIGSLTRVGLSEHQLTSLYAAEMARQDPDGAPEYGLMAMTGAHRIVNEIARF